MATTTEFAVLTDDLPLREELRAAHGALGPEAPRIRFVANSNELLDAVRTRPPRFVIAPFGDAPQELLQMSRELSSLSPPIPVVAVFRPNEFRDSISESDLLIDALRAGVRDFLRRPVSAAELRLLIEGSGQTQSSSSQPNTATVGRVVSFISNKGGVGKSTLAANAAVGLALRRPGRVLLVDASLQMGVAASLLDLRPHASLLDVARERDRLDATMIRQLATVHETGLHLLAAPADAVEATEVDDTLITRVISLASRVYDHVIIDTFPMFDRVIIATLDLSDQTYLVMENVVPTLQGAVRLIDVLQRMGYPVDRQRIIVNRQQRAGGSLSLADIEDRLGRRIDHVLPFDRRVVEAANCGEPIALRHSFFRGFSRALRRLVDEIDSTGDDRRVAGDVSDAARRKPVADQGSETR